ncbi:MAG: MFS transporter [Opitutaceae bacterium]|nr:MFS transporter [Opitutaceae bacterium]
MSPSSFSAVPKQTRTLSLGVIFLTLYIDLVGFSIIFPLAPDLLKHYLALDGAGGALGWFLARLTSVSAALGNTAHLPEVLFGGVISSVFAALQFVFAPLWGALSDRIGRRGVLRFTVLGTAASYLLWAFSGSFWLFLGSRVLAGAFGGNLSVATAAVADVTTREERSRAMGLVGAAFGLGLVTGPLVGAFSAQVNLSGLHPPLAAYGVNPFSMPALISFALALVNLAWINARFHETLPTPARTEARIGTRTEAHTGTRIGMRVEAHIGTRTEAHTGAAGSVRVRNPLRAILSLDNAPVRGVNLVSFIYSLAFVAMETSLVFLGAERFGYTARENGMLMGFLGLCSILTQGMIVRRLYKRLRETTVLACGLVCSMLGFVATGFAASPAMLCAGVALLALGGGLINPSMTGLISLYSSAAEQGRVLGIFRSLGALARAVTPVVAGVVFFTAGARVLYAIAALLAAVAWGLSQRLPQPDKNLPA